MTNEKILQDIVKTIMTSAVDEYVETAALAGVQIEEAARVLQMWCIGTALNLANTKS